MYLLKGVCDFHPQTGVYYLNQAIYDFETNAPTTDGAAPEYVRDTSYCGYQSLLVSGEIIIIDPETESAG